MKKKAATKRSRIKPRRKLRKNLASGVNLSDLSGDRLHKLATGLFLLADAFGLLDKAGPISSYVAPSGVCPCLCGHLAIAGVACPESCPNRGNHFDGCHECNCETGRFYKNHHPEQPCQA